MQLQEIKKPSVEINGLIFDIDRVGSTVKRVTVKDRGGRVKLMVNCGPYSVEVLEVQPPKMKKVFRMKATVLEQPITKDFETMTEAEVALEELPTSANGTITEAEVEDVG